MKTIYFLSLNMIQFVPYAYGFLRSHVEQDKLLAGQYQWKEPFCRIEPVETIVNKIVNPDIVCTSNYVWNNNQQMKILEGVKRKHPDCLVVCGGPHVPNSGDEYLLRYPQADILVHGEGEIPFRDLLNALLRPSPDLSGVAGIRYRSGKKICRTPDGPKLAKDLPVPSPYLMGYFDKFLSGDNAKIIALLETNRGCPFACCFCDWGVRTRNKIRLHPMDRVAREIEYLAEKKIEDIYITDSNFGLFPRDMEIARMLADSKKRQGYPKRVRIQFAKKSNRTVFQISKMLHENGMLWGTTLSMQSVDITVLEAIERPYESMRTYQALQKQYRDRNIPTYTELILGLPRETGLSFVQGICKLFELEMHDDFRVFELALLPNAPLNQKSLREKYRLNTRFKPIRLPAPGCEKEYVELVLGTRTMTMEEWSYCLLFSEMTQALHNGGYTQFPARYLHKTGVLSYYDFYTNLLSFLIASEEESCSPFHRVRKLITDYCHDPDMPQVNRLMTQPDMMQFLRTYHPDRKGWPIWTYIWLRISEDLESFYATVIAFLQKQKVSIHSELKDLMQYQKDIMLSLDYDPVAGKNNTYAYNWYGYFHNGEELQNEAIRLQYTDQKMGASGQYELEKNNKKKFVTAAIGYSYPYSKYRHFFHQPDMTTCIRVSSMETVSEKKE